jgi:archaellum component FlaC
MKKILNIIFLAGLIFLLLPVLPVWAENANLGATPGAERAKPKEEVKVQKQEEVIARLKERASQEIDRWVGALNKLIERINAFKHLTADQKTALTSQVQTEINNLNALKNKIAADTDLTTLKTDAQSIIKSYRIYALFIPKIHLLAVCDTALDLLDTKIKDITARIQAKISEAKSSGKDVAAAETSLNSLKTKISGLKTQLQSIQSSVMALTPEGYPGNKAGLETARQNLQSIHKDIQAIRQDIKNIIQGLRGLNKVTPATLKTTPPATASGSLPKEN